MAAVAGGPERAGPEAVCTEEQPPLAPGPAAASRSRSCCHRCSRCSSRKNELRPAEGAPVVGARLGAAAAPRADAGRALCAGTAPACASQRQPKPAVAITAERKVVRPTSL
eukprot:7382358-Prymnesium_polylepis.2